MPHLFAVAREQGVRVIRSRSVEEADVDVVLERRYAEHPVEALVRGAVAEGIVVDDLVCRGPPR
jgi:hypothetical protein